MMGWHSDLYRRVGLGFLGRDPPACVREAGIEDIEEFAWGDGEGCGLAEDVGDGA